MKVFILAFYLFLAPLNTYSLTPPNSECLKVKNNLVVSCSQQRYRSLFQINGNNHKLEDVELNESTISKSSFTNVHFTRVTFRGAIFTDVKFINSHFEDVDFSGAKFFRTIFENAKMTNASLISAYFDHSQISLNKESQNVQSNNCLSLASTVAPKNIACLLNF